ncbi:cytochrome P450 [Actinomadura craniellae]|uniref:Cytochrome P450 n=1 Tax=Actinomadura craniellae TaxID=2231787 RepID=A0A365HA08_9ACTN|nr:cytochrome P450 [Actinomadura craniellae]RAY15859.1 cytochrome P450 [Actinomadura craniellae]
MSTDPRARPARTVPLRRLAPGFLRDPLAAFEKVGTDASGEIIRLNAGTFRPYLVTDPDHVQHVLRGNSANYRRKGMFWNALERLLGDGILGDGPTWEHSRRNLQPVFTSRNVTSLTERMAETVNQAVDQMAWRGRSGRTVEASQEMNSVVNQTVIKIFFGDRISQQGNALLVPAFETIVHSIAFRLLLPFVPNAVPLPGDRAFLRSVKTVDSVVYPVIREVRRLDDGGDDVIATLCRVRGPDGEPLTDRQIRDDVVSMLGAGTETTSVALTWLWPALEANPEVAETLYEEIDRVVGSDPVGPQHLPDLEYTRMVIQELLRLFPVGWLFPRTAVGSDVIDGVKIEAGATMLFSPLITHHLESIWPDPLTFDPERFRPENARNRHRYAYFPFGGGQHQCLGMHVFNIEAQLIVAAILSRFRPKLTDPRPVKGRIAATVRPRDKIGMTLQPVIRTGHPA